MNLQQCRSVREAVRCGFNLTEVAHALHTSQPGVSRQIRVLEEALGIELLVGAGKRLTSLTAPGQHVLPIIARMRLDSANLREAGPGFVAQQNGLLSMATPSRRHAMRCPPRCRHFTPSSPTSSSSGTRARSGKWPRRCCRAKPMWALPPRRWRSTTPCYRWTHSVIVQPGHPLQDAPLTLEHLAQWPLITYDNGFTGRSHIDEAFGQRQQAPNIVLPAMDADVIKTDVELGMGVGTVASIACEAGRDTGLRAIDASRRFGINLTRLAVRRGSDWRGDVYAFIESFASTLNCAIVEQALADDGPASDYDI